MAIDIRCETCSNNIVVETVLSKALVRIAVLAFSLQRRSSMAIRVKKGPWSPEEDRKLKDYIHTHGTGGNWIALPTKADDSGLKRCGKSCRLRWLNYLRPNIKHGDFSEEEDRVICALFAAIGSRWSIIAAQLPGRTDNDVKNYWNTKLKKKQLHLLIAAAAQSTHGQQYSSRPPAPPFTVEHHHHTSSTSAASLGQLLMFGVGGGDHHQQQQYMSSSSSVDISNNTSAAAAAAAAAGLQESFMFGGLQFQQQEEDTNSLLSPAAAASGNDIMTYEHHEMISPSSFFFYGDGAGAVRHAPSPSSPPSITRAELIAGTTVWKEENAVADKGFEKLLKILKKKLPKDNELPDKLFRRWKKELNKFVENKETPEFKGRYKKIRDHWPAFVAHKTSEKSKKMSATNKQNAAKKKHHHRTGSGFLVMRIQWEETFPLMTRRLQ
ncbi:uncharacterized protein [Triticum aestivum]|uniref:uncharacterized protein n=1 Tax=Triticum aestivum TaxID=4565 RepID=UPI001D02FAB5|nr:uncharacterized protein LOC123152625 [Triticum aestivum]